MADVPGITWAQLRSERPDLAEAGRSLLYQVGVGLAFLGTTAFDGAPRVHPMCPVMDDHSIHAFIVPGPKQRDLIRDGRYALHSFPCPDNEDAFYVTGGAVLVEDAGTRSRLADVFVSERSAFSVPPPGPAELLFELRIERCMLTRTTGHGDPHPNHEIWHADTRRVS